ncbi:MAG: GNAT family N-acetyltransferase [Nocardioides sp.]
MTIEQRIATIRERRDTDLPNLANVLVEVHQRDGYPVEGVGDPTSWLVVEDLVKAWTAIVNDEAVGHVALSEPGPDDQAALLWQNLHTGSRPLVLGRLFVSTRARGLGLGRELTTTATRYAHKLRRPVVLDVMNKDHAAITIYEALGWSPIGTIDHVHSGGRIEPARAYVAPPS